MAMHNVFEVTFSVDNEFFAEFGAAEVARVLERLADRVRTGEEAGFRISGTAMPLYDFNGTRIGVAQYRRVRDKVAAALTDGPARPGKGRGPATDVG